MTYRMLGNHVRLSTACLLTTALGTATAAHSAAGPSGDGPPRSPVHRAAQPRPAIGPGNIALGESTMFPFEFRSIDGVGNNPIHPDWGATGATLIRTMPNAYADSIGAPAGPDLPSAREISNFVAKQDTGADPLYGHSDFLWQWGQFLDHDVDETPVTAPGEAFDIDVPMGDPWFDPNETGVVTIPLDRSAFLTVEGVREQLNNITAYIDASNVYGADTARALELRTLDGTGRLKTSAGNLLPFNVNGFDNAPTSKDPTLFLAGDVRCNEQSGLTAMHTLFVREHNYWASTFGKDNPDLTGDELYEYARAIVAGEMQAITYNEFLPRLLGPEALPSYTGYDIAMDPGITNIFATSAYRMGHTMLSSFLLRLDANGDPIAAGHLPLAQAFFNPQHILDHGIDSLLRGLAGQTAQNVDNMLIDDVRNFLFGPPGAGGFDLAALNIQRGRDHGLPPYADVCTAVGLDAPATFADVSPDPDVQARLASAYDSPTEIDSWVGLLAEPHYAGGVTGETLQNVLRNQFIALRDGDRFWYESYLPADLVALVEQQTLAVIIRRNTSIGEEIADDVFGMPIPCVADINGSGSVNTDDLLALLGAWGVCADCPEDINADGAVTILDLVALLGSWGTCDN